MTRTRTSVLTATFFLLAGALALALVLLAGRSSGSGNQANFQLGAGGVGVQSKEAAAGEGRAGGFEAYRAAARTYPANAIPPSIVKRAEVTFNRIAKRDARLAKRLGRSFQAHDKKWQQFGPRRYSTEPGVIAFSGATNNTASRTVALVADPDCSARRCRLWAGTAGGGVWRTDNAVTPDPEWKQVAPDDLEQNSVGQLVLDPTDRKHDTLYLATGEGNRCSSGCEAGVGIYRSRDAGNHWTKLAGRCVQRRVPVREPRQGLVPRPRDQRARDRPAQRQAHLRRLRAGRSRSLAHDRQRRHDAPRARRQPAGSVRVVRRRHDVHRSLERERPERLRRHRRRPRPAQPGCRLRLGVRPGRVAA